MGDVVGLHAHPPDVQRAEIGLGDLLDLPVRGQQPGAVAADLTVLAKHAELQREPEHLGDELQCLGGLDPPDRLAGHPVERREAVVGQAVAVAEHLVQHVGLGGVERDRVVPDVLGGVEDAVGQGAVEVQQRHQPGGWDVLESGERAEQVVDLGQLRDPGLGKAEPLLALEIDGAGVPLVQAVQLGADHAPDLMLGLGVRRDRRRRSGLPRQGQCGQSVAPGAVFRVDRAGVVVAQVNGDIARAGAGHRRVELGFFEHRCLRGVRTAPSASSSGGCLSGSRIRPPQDVVL